MTQHKQPKDRSIRWLDTHVPWERWFGDLKNRDRNDKFSQKVAGIAHSDTTVALLSVKETYISIHCALATNEEGEVGRTESQRNSRGVFCSSPCQSSSCNALSGLPVEQPSYKLQQKTLTGPALFVWLGQLFWLFRLRHKASYPRDALRKSLVSRGVLPARGDTLDVSNT